MINLSNIASIATLILFFMYFIGRIWTISKEKHFASETFSVTAFSGNDNAIINYDEEMGDIITIISSVAYKRLSIKEGEYDWNNNCFVSKKEVFVIYDVPVNRAIVMRVDIPDIAIRHQVSFQRYDGMKGSFFLARSGKDGSFIPYNYELHHTFSSVMFYIFK